MKVSLKIAVVVVVATLLAISVVTVADPNPQKAAGNGPQVKIDNFTFAPNALTVPVGTTVQWVNRDDIPHTVVSDDKATFKSKVLDTDDSFSHTFSKAGAYSYFCSLHPKMAGKVVVE